MEQLLKITKALADETRVRMLGALRHGELCVCQVIELLGLAPSTISKHLSILKGARLIESRKEGRWMYYRLARRPGGDAGAEALAWIFCCLDGSSRFIEDQRRLKQILEMDPETLCSRQSHATACNAENAPGKIAKNQDCR